MSYLKRTRLLSCVAVATVLLLGSVKTNAQDADAEAKVKRLLEAKRRAAAEAKKKADTAKAEPAGKNPYAERLKKNKITPDAAGVLAYLKQIRPTPKTLKHIGDLIEQLGAERCRRRRAAETELGALGLLAEQAVKQATLSGDPEVKMRAKRLLTKFQSTDSSILFYAALKTLNRLKPKRAAPVILGVMPLCGKRYLYLAATKALADLTGPGDKQSLWQALKHKNALVRAAAAVGLGKLLGPKGAADLYPYLHDPEAKVRLAAAQALGDYGDRHCLETLINLLAVKELEARMDSAATLRELTGKQFAFAAYDTEKKRAKAVKGWRAWLAQEGDAAKLNFPLKGLFGRSYLGGHTLLAYGHKGKVEELDQAGKVVWSYNITGAWSAEKMANGNVLIAGYSVNKVVEVNAKGDVLWEYKSNCLNAKPLPNGNVLIADYGGKRVIEVQKQGNKVVWEYKAKGNCCDVQRLDSGNTLIGATDGVYEVTRAGKTVWEYKSRNVYGIQRLRNGNTLMVNNGQGKVYELTPDKKIVWEFKENSVCDVFRLPNGNTLLSSGQRFIEVSPDQKIVWTKDGCSYGTARK